MIATWVASAVALTSGIAILVAPSGSGLRLIGFVVLVVLLAFAVVLTLGELDRSDVLAAITVLGTIACVIVLALAPASQTLSYAGASAAGLLVLMALSFVSSGGRSGRIRRPPH